MKRSSMFENRNQFIIQILASGAKHDNPQADTSKLEAEIDQLVYQLYGLTKEEIEIVEGKQ
jgi:adenine-specific DNA-methyltransferase